MLRGVTPFWKWKTALNSGPNRGVLSAAASWRTGAAAWAGVALTQMLLFGAPAGVTGALVQRFRNYQPRWRAGVALLGLAPLAVHSMEWLVHETPHSGRSRAGIAVSWRQSAVSMATQWAMTGRGLFLAGESGPAYVQHLRAVAQLLSRLLRGPVRR